MGNFCYLVFFFTSPDFAELWRAAHPGTLFYSPEEAFEQGARLVTKQFGHALQRPSPVPAG